MDAISYEYTKQRKQFGLHPVFVDSSVLLESIETEPETPPSSTISDLSDPSQQYTPLSPLDTDNIPPPKSHAQWMETVNSTVELDCIPCQSAHEVNTERYVQHAKGTSHTDGAWPSEIKTNEFVDRQRYVRRLLNEPAYYAAVVNLTKLAESVIAQNNTIDCYQQYFPENNESYEITESSSNAAIEHDSITDFHSSPPSAKTVCVFRDPNNIKRTATKISWHPDAANKLAVAYSITSFQSQPRDTPLYSYIWDVTSPNHPDAKLIPQSSLTTLAYNPRSPDHLVGGAYNGMLSFFDLRKGGTPVENSLLERSHHDPVYDVYWIQSRTGNECCSISTDGQLLWWDIRKLKLGYTDSMYLTGENDIRYGGMSMEYKSDAGATRFLVGTEQGMAMLCDRKAKKDSESQKSIKSTYGLSGGAHHGPIYSIQRNPFNLKYFLTVGDWSAKIWMEDLREPIIHNRYDRAYLTAGQWSNTRPGVYYTSKSDGCLDVWDLYHRQESPVYTLKVTDTPTGLTSMKVHSAGKLIALGDGGGSVNIISVSRGLVEVQKDEKAIIANIFERETKREKALEVRKQQAKRDAGKMNGTMNLISTTSNNNNMVLPIIGSTASSIASVSISSNPPLSASLRPTQFLDEIHEDEESKEAIRKAEEEFFVLIDEKTEELNSNENRGGGMRQEQKEQLDIDEKENPDMYKDEDEEKTNEDQEEDD